MAEIIEKTGKSYNIFDKINNVWNKCSFWTHSNDVFYPDGKSATTKHSAINGITSDITGEAEDIAASIKCVNQLNSSLESMSNKLPVIRTLETTLTAVDTWSYIDYPDGFNKDNTIVISAMIQYSSGVWIGVIHLGKGVLETMLHTNGVAMETNYSAYLNKRCKITIMRYE